MKKTYDVIVIGGGAAGMIAAGTAAERGLSTLLLEKNEKLGKKLFITGKGRCNITNSAEREEFFSNITKNPKFFFSAFSTFSNEDLVRLLNELGLRTKVERGNRVFPDSDKSSDVIKAFTKYLDRTGVDIQLEAEALKVESVEDQLFVTMRSGEKIHGTSVIISTGGISYPQTGSTGDGYRFAEALGHSIVPPTPSLVPLLTEGPLAAELQGLSLKNVEVHVYSSEKKVFSDFGEMLFTHFGLTGPIILSASFYVVPLLKKNKEVRICIDLKPALAAEELDKRILKDFTKNSNKQFKNALDELLPGKMIPAVVKLSGIDPEKPVNIINRDERKRLVQILKGLEFKIKGTRPVSEAIVTSGGVSIKEINPKTMESKTVKGLYFAGEVLDLDAYTGGFNLQIAFSTGRVAGMNA